MLCISSNIVTEGIKLTNRGLQMQKETRTKTENLRISFENFDDAEVIDSLMS